MYVQFPYVYLILIPCRQVYMAAMHCHVHLSARYNYFVFCLAFCTQAMVVDWFCG